MIPHSHPQRAAETNVCNGFINLRPDTKYLFSAKGADLNQPGAPPQEARQLPFER